jgi:hypothetical protein
MKKKVICDGMQIGRIVHRQDFAVGAVQSNNDAHDVQGTLQYLSIRDVDFFQISSKVF